MVKAVAVKSRVTVRGEIATCGASATNWFKNRAVIIANANCPPISGI